MVASEKAMRRILACEKKRSDSLDLTSMALETLPERVTEFTWLKSLHLGDNSLVALPLTIGNLTAINTLELNGNPINELPDSFGNLLELQVLWCAGTKLWLGGNRITTIPAWVGDLTSLEFLSLWGNPVTSVAPEIGRLANLRTFDVRETLLKPPFPNFINGRTEIVTESMRTPPKL